MNQSHRIGMLLVIYACASCANESTKDSKWLITVSKETTRLREPLTEDGLVDYFEALEQHLREGVTVENNAGVLIAQAFGPKVIAEAAREGFYRRLGIEPLTANESNFVSFEDYLAEIGFEGDVEQIEDRRYALPRRTWKRSDEPTLHEWIVRNEAALDLLVEASRRDKLYLPQLIAGNQDALHFRTFLTLPSVEWELRQATFALATRATLHVGEGRPQAAHEDALAIHRLARLLSQAPNLTTKAMSYSVESLACSCDYLIAHYGQPTVDQALQMRRAIEALPPVEGIIDSIDIGERFRALDVAQSFAHGHLEQVLELPMRGPLMRFFRKLPTGRVINFDVALKMLNEFYDRVVTALREADPVQRAELLASIDAETAQIKKDAENGLQRLPREMLRGKSDDELGRITGEFLLGILCDEYQPMYEFETRVLNLRDMAGLTLALAAYRADHGQYPAQLSELVPKYIDQLPQDRYCGDSFRYSVTNDQYRLYSVGLNGVDDEGRVSRSTPPGDDVPIHAAMSD